MYNLTDLANRCIQVASQFASRTTNQVGTEHILYALSKVESKAKQLLNAHRVTSDTVQQILSNIGSGGVPSNVVELTPRVKEMLAISSNVADTFKAYLETIKSGEANNAYFTKRTIEIVSMAFIGCIVKSR